MAVFQTNRTVLLKRINPNKMNLMDFASEASAFDDYLLKDVFEQLIVTSFDSFVERFQPHLRIGFDFRSLDIKVLAQEDEDYLNDGYRWEHIEIRDKNHLEALLFQNTKERMLRPFQDIVDGLLGSDQADDFISEFSRLTISMTTEKKESCQAKAHEFYRKWDSTFLLLSAMQKLSKKRKDVLDVSWVLNEEALLKESQIKTIDVLHRDGSHVSPEIISQLEEWLNDLDEVKAKTCWQWWFSLQVQDDELVNKACNQLYEKLILALQDEINEFLSLLLNVYFYFQTYGDTIGFMAPELLILNIDAKDLDAKALLKLDAFLNECNEKNDFRSMIWYAILPVEFKEEERKPVRERFRGNALQENDERVLAPEDYREIIEIFAKYRIQVFASEENVSRFLKDPKEFIQEVPEEFAQYEQLTDKEHARYLWACVPNIRVLPQREAKYVFHDTQNILFQGINIDAAYVAAGMISACQDPTFLKRIFKEDEVADEPGVRMSDLNGLCQACENYEEQLPKMLPILRGDALEEKRTHIQGILVYGTVNGMRIYPGMVRGEEPDSFYSFDEVQTMTYVERTIRRETRDYERGAIEKFFLPVGDHAYQHWIAEKDKINAVFRYRETLEHEISDDILLLRFVFQNDKKEVAVRIKR